MVFPRRSSLRLADVPPQGVPIGWEPALAEAFYRDCDVSKSGKYSDGTPYCTGLVFVYPFHQRHTEPGISVSVSISERESEGVPARRSDL